MATDDKSLIDAHCRGDRAAFGELLGRHGPGVLGYLVRMTGDRTEADDLFQETFRRVHEKAGTVVGTNVKSWIFTIATRVALDGYRKRARHRMVSLTSSDRDGDVAGQVPEAAILRDDESDPAVLVEANERRDLVRKAIGRLPERQRVALVLSYYQKMTYAEVAQVLGCSEGSVKTHMFRALRSLATSLPDPAGGEL